MIRVMLDSILKEQEFTTTEKLGEIQDLLCDLAGGDLREDPTTIGYWDKVEDLVEAAKKLLEGL